MKRYKNLSGQSGIVAFELGADSIRIKFNDGFIYLYTARSSGSLHVRNMQQLAMDGEGLNSYISRHVREHYASKSRG